MGNLVEEPANYLKSPRHLWSGAALTVAAAVVAVLAVREIAVRMIHPNPSFSPLSPGSGIIATVVCTIIAIYVFRGMFCYPNSVRPWRRVATAVLILSFLPNVLLAISHIPEACALAMMHVVVWAICITLLPSLALSKHAPKSQSPDRPLSIL
jgi:ABC-type nickel/cobalt efflux system permease component RcnA